MVNEALLGTEPDRDLARLIDGTARTTGALVRNEAQLKDLITNFNTTMAAFAARAGEPAAPRSALLAPTLETANRALDSLNAAFPPTRAFAREILPGVRETPATIDAAFPWIAQTRKLVSPGRAAAASRRTSRPTTRDLAAADRRVARAAAADRPRLAVRARRRPADRRRRDPATSSRPASRTTRSSGTRWSGSPARARTSTATASTCASRPAAARDTVRSARALGADRPAVRQRAPRRRSATGPTYPGKRPPLQPTSPCYSRRGRPQRPGDRRADTAPWRPRTAPSRRCAVRHGTAVRTAIRKHLRDFVAIIVLS